MEFIEGVMGSLIQATNLWGYDELVKKLGGDPNRYLARFHIPPAPERPDDSFVLYRSGVLLLEATAAQLKCPDFGLRLAQWQGLEMLGPVAVIARNSGSVIEAFEAIASYLYIHCPALLLRLQPSGTGDWVQFDYRITELSPPQLRQSYELSLANAMQILRMLAGESARPELVSFLHGQVGSDESYAKSFGCEVRFDQDWCGWRISAKLARQPIDHADSQALYYATRYLESHYAPGSTALSARVTELIGRLLPTGLCSADTIAAELAIHPRTLQRHLAEEGYRYEELLDRERRQQAIRYLGEPGLHMVQIAGLLGYTEQSTLSRSCRRWFGTTPKKYREQLQASLPSGANGHTP
ncbi:AraC family transcriptional regulator [Marinobacter sp. GN3S48]|uniref:AraC family transcriptional regulator n=1 Tax=Marinobacter sp. GN3S48 TaxID=3382302 RepID=UPI00387AEFD5